MLWLWHCHSGLSRCWKPQQHQQELKLHPQFPNWRGKDLTHFWGFTQDTPGNSHAWGGSDCTLPGEHVMVYLKSFWAATREDRAQKEFFTGSTLDTGANNQCICTADSWVQQVHQYHTFLQISMTSSEPKAPISIKQPLIFWGWRWTSPVFNRSLVSSHDH